MYRAMLVSLVLFAVAGMSSRLDAKVMPWRKLTLDQRMAVEASERRLATYDRALRALEIARWKKKIGRTEYGYEKHDLIGYISAEARFQNDILIDDRPFPPEDVREVMENIAKYTILVPAYVLAIAATAFAGTSYTSH